MFGQRYFGKRYFGARYFGSMSKSAVVAPGPVELTGEDDSICELAMCEDTIGGPRSEPWPVGLDHAVWINGSRAGAVQLGQVSCQRDVGQRGTARITLLRTPDLPTQPPAIGSRIEISWRDHLQWGGMVENVRTRTQAGTVGIVWWYELDCASWERLAEKRMTALAYTETTTRDIFLDVLDRVLSAEGVKAGIIDEGVTLSLAGPQQDGQPIRVSDFIRDVSEASGGVSEIDPFKRLNFRKTSIRHAGITLTNIIALESVTSAQERQDYRNAQTVKVTGTDGAVAFVYRESASEINTRQSIELSSGIYEAYEEISHPTSNDEVELQKLGIGVAAVLLSTYGRHARKVQVQINKPQYRLGDIVQLEFAEHEISGSWQIAGMKFRAINETLRVDLELYQTSLLQRAYQSWLKVIGVAKSAVSVQGIGIFTHTQTFSTSGTWTVPNLHGDGSSVEVQVECFGAGGGGASGAIFLYQPSYPSPPFIPINLKGGAGGNGGRAVSFRTYTPGTVLTVVVGAGGSAGVSDGANGSVGGVTSLSDSSGFVAQANAGNGGLAPVIIGGGGPGRGTAGIPGAAGGGVGDFAYVAQGHVGGIGGLAQSQGVVPPVAQPGQNGSVNIYW